MPNYYIHDSAGERGPFTDAQIRSMWNSGGITADARCRPDGTNEWKPLPALLDVNSKEPPRAESKAGAVFVLALIIGGLVCYVVGNNHFITGKEVGFTVVPRDSFGFSEAFINVDAITGMPWLAARIQHPIACRVLQRELIIQAPDTKP